MPNRTPSAENYYLGRGAVYFDRFDENGNRTGELHLGNCKDARISLSSTTKEHKNYLTGSSETDLEVVAETKAEIQLTLDEYQKDILALAFLGDQGTLSQGSGTVTDEAIVARKNRWMKLQYRNISSVVVTSQDGSTTYSEGTDYQVDAERGRIYIDPDGNITDGATILVDYSYSAVTKETIQALKNAKVEGFLRFVPAEDMTGPRYEAECWKVRLRPDLDFSMITDDWGEIRLRGSLVKDSSHPEAPYFRLIEL